MFPIACVSAQGSDPLAPLVSPSQSTADVVLGVSKTILWVILALGFVFSLYNLINGDFRKGFYGFIISSLVFAIIYGVLTFIGGLIH